MAPPRSPTPAQRPSASLPAQLAAYPGLPMASEAGAAPRARCPLPWAALLLLVALLPVVSPAGAPGTRSPGLAARLSAPPRRLSVHPPCTTTHPACRSGDRRPLCAVRVLSLTCASSSLAGRGAEGAAGESGSGYLALRAREADVGTPLVPGPSVPWFQLCRRTPRSPETRAVSLTSPKRVGQIKKNKQEKKKATLLRCGGGGGDVSPWASFPPVHLPRGRVACWRVALRRPAGRQGGGTFLKAHGEKLRAARGRSGTSAPKHWRRSEGGQYLPVGTLELGEDLGLERRERKVREPIREKLALPRRD